VVFLFITTSQNATHKTTIIAVVVYTDMIDAAANVPSNFLKSVCTQNFFCATFIWTHL